MWIHTNEIDNCSRNISGSIMPKDKTMDYFGSNPNFFVKKKLTKKPLSIIQYIPPFFCTKTGVYLVNKFRFSSRFLKLKKFGFRSGPVGSTFVRFGSKQNVPCGLVVKRWGHVVGISSLKPDTTHVSWTCNLLPLCWIWERLMEACSGDVYQNIICFFYINWTKLLDNELHMNN